MSNILELNAISKTYQLGAESLQILKDASFAMQAGESVALVGPSGAGKSTLLQIAGLLDDADSGEVMVCGESAHLKSDQELTKLRNQSLGFVYQFHHLIPECSALENVLMPAQLAGHYDKAKATELLHAVGLSKRIDHRPAELSGGEKQRVAIARALMNEPQLLLADEPTGNLDAQTADDVMALLLSLCESRGLAILMATHNLALAKRCQKMITIEAGAITRA